MAQTFFNPKQAATYLGLEPSGSFAVTPAMNRLFVIGNSFTYNPTQAELENNDERNFLFDYLNTVRGMLDGTGKFDIKVSPSTTQYANAAPVTHPIGTLLAAILGGSASSSGSNVTGAPTTGSVPVLNGALFQMGQIALFPCTNGLEPGRITAISGNTLTVSPGLSSAPTSGSTAVGMDCYFPTEQNFQSFTLQHAKALSSTMQFTFNGCVATDLAFSAKRNDLIKASVSWKCATWTTGSQAITTTIASDPNVVPLAVRNAQAVLKTTVDGLYGTYPIWDYEVKIKTGMDFALELGGTEGKTQAVRTGDTMFAEATLKFVADQTMADVNWTNQTLMQLMLRCPVGSGTSKRWVVFDMPTCVPVGKPQYSNENGLQLVTMTLRSKMNQLNTNQTSDLTRAPFMVAVG